MRRVNRYYVQLALLILMSFLTAGIVTWDNAGKSHAIMKSAESDHFSGGTFESEVWIGDNLWVRWWKNVTDNSYNIFLPGAVKGKKLNVTYSGAERIFVDGERIQNGKSYLFSEGQHIVRTEGSECSEHDLNVWYTSDIPALFVETESGSADRIHASKEEEESGRMMIMDSRGRNYFEGNIERIRCRGNSSYEDTEKKSYTIKLCKKADLFGMGAAKKWILTANAFDDTLVRNAAAFSIAHMLGLDYTPDVCFVDVYMNGNFIGNYLLSEKVEVGKNRVNIRNLEEEVEALNKVSNPEDMEFFMEQQGRLFSTKGYRIAEEPEDISGGYLLELETSDRYGLEASGFLTSRMQPVVFASPEYASYAQVSYVAQLYQDFEDAVFSEDGYSPYTGKAYSEYIDMDSFARKYLVEELVKNLDASFTSQYIYKYDDAVSTKFYAGPCWDYDKSIAASGITEDGIDLHDPVGLYAAMQEKDSDIWYALYQHEDFRKKTATIFFEELEPQLRQGAEELIYGFSRRIDRSNDCNMIRWNTFPQTEELAEKQSLRDAKVEELVDFINRRLDFLEMEWGYLRNE
ncbi:MAG: CotH kinase family protein [Lachnospiraceae bacterium]|nr:CotH kinase family protein [Lachnospiraceae bacterium]